MAATPVSGRRLCFKEEEGPPNPRKGSEHGHEFVLGGARSQIVLEVTGGGGFPRQQNPPAGVHLAYSYPCGKSYFLASGIRGCQSVAHPRCGIGDETGVLLWAG